MKRLAAVTSLPLLALALATNASAQHQLRTNGIIEMLANQALRGGGCFFDNTVSRGPSADPVPVPIPRNAPLASKKAKARGFIPTANDSCFDGSAGNGCPALPTPTRPPAGNPPPPPPPPPAPPAPPLPQLPAPLPGTIRPT